MTLLTILPILIPLLTAVFMLLAWQRIDRQRWLSLGGAGGLLIVGLLLVGAVDTGDVLAVQIGNWPAPFGITLVADLLSAIMLVLIGLIGLAVTVYGLASVDAERQADGYYPLVQVLLMALAGAVLTGDLFNLFVWFEVMLIASFVLLALGGGRGQIEGAFKYMALNLFASSLFLAAVGILYGVAGTLNMADLALRFAAGVVAPGLMSVLAMLFLVALGIKAALFPLFFWLPASYHTAPPVISALFAGLLTKVAVYVLIRLFTLLFVHDTGYTHTLLLWLAGFTMVTGVLGAAAQNEIRRILSFHIVSQIGYMIMGLAILTPLALTGAIFFVMHNIIVKTNLFLIGGVVQRIQRTEQLNKLGGLYSAWPGLTMLFLISALALAGLPPFSGFWAKLLLVQAGLAAEAWIIVGVSLFVSILTLYSMTKIWNEAFWKRPADESFAPERGEPMSPSTAWLLFSPIVVLALLTVSIGVIVEPLLQLTGAAAAQLLAPTAYIEAVLGANTLSVARSN
ncbi:MAG: proton-conducting transporter membrane subunit [Caldilineaceae bacterium]